jgi:predicted O-linked N-acetylglucosamine transferase (SPINDLY family)
MTLTAFPAALALPGDEAWLSERLGRAGGLAALPETERAYAARAVAALPAATLITLAGAAPDEDAATLAQGWLAAHDGAPEAFAVWFNLGVALFRLGRFADAAGAYGQALRLRPELHEAAVNLGLALERQGRPDEALAAWRRALPPPAARVTLHNHLGRLMEEKGRLEEAAAELRASLLIDPDQPDVMQHYGHIRQRMGEWPVIDPALPGAPPAKLALNIGPLGALALHEDPADQRAVGEAWIARKVPAAPERLAPACGYDHDRLRIGYLSSDFCRHALGYLVAELFERHDRAGFSIHAYCNTRDDGSDLRARIVAAFDAFTPIRGMGDEEAARRIRADEIDVLVDLNGLTKGARPGLLRWKPAPVQATWLGYIGPVPLPELDWMLCDAVAVPEGTDAAYAPRPWRLPGCFQANDGRTPELPEVSRASEGLPEGPFVFCCFSHHYKLTPEVWGAWLDILSAAPDAVLWIVDDGPASRRNLTARWAARGLDPARLIFAPRVDPARYRARMALADLFLDTAPYNAGVIATDALRMGLPLLTLAGRSFVGRQATSLLTAVGLTDFVAESREDYVARALAYAADPAWQASVRARLAGGAWAKGLGDAEGFARRLEDAYRGMVAALRG